MHFESSPVHMSMQPIDIHMPRNICKPGVMETQCAKFQIYNLSMRKFEVAVGKLHMCRWSKFVRKSCKGLANTCAGVLW